MRELLFEGKNYTLAINKTANGAMISGGRFGALAVGSTTLFTLQLRNLATREELTLTSLEGWRTVRLDRREGYARALLCSPDCGIDLSMTVEIRADGTGVQLDLHVSNTDERFSVLEVGYPMPQIKNDVFDLFVSSGPGRVVPDVRHSDFTYRRIYPSLHCCMQYIACFAEGDALYVGHHDVEARTKYYDISGAEGRIAASYPAECMGLGANSFTVRGGVRWEYLRGDWYDVAMRYARFAEAASWMPEIGSYGRPDTPDYFKELPFWIMDFMPNIPEQGNNMPERLRYAVNTDKDAWWREGIRMREALGVPCGYHVYNWHKNAFNIDYPHFLPAKDDFAAGVRRLQAAGVYVAPYINASSWESRDCAPSEAESFAVAGIRAAAKDKDGKYIPKVYPQIKPDGEKTVLVAVCPSSPTWQQIIRRLSHRIEEELGVDGVYYDEASAMPAYPCTDRTHAHTPGNSGAWVEGIRARMRRIRNEKAAGKFSFSECNAEPYINAFDGFLTWHWGENGEVPAFPAIYSRYITMLGRVINGYRKDDKVLVRYTFATSFLFGQQLGWCNHDVQDDAAVFGFLKELVALRYALRALFVTGRLLRPPHVQTSLPVHRAPHHMWGHTELALPVLQAGCWQAEDGVRHLFVLNAADEGDEATLTLRAREYGIVGIPAALAPYAPVLSPDGEMLTMTVPVAAQGILHLTF